MAPMDDDRNPRLGAISDWIGTILRYRSGHPAATRILDVIERLIDHPYRTHALLYGEPGTGKEGLARALHAAMHPGRDTAFVKITSGGRDPAILTDHLFGRAGRDGALDRAAGGTLFLDEVATLPREVQARLAPALRGRFRRSDDETPCECDVVVIGATDHDLATTVREGGFRHDLYHRLARIELGVPPLRERSTDIPGTAVWIGNRLLAMHGSGRRLVREGDSEQGAIVLGRDAIEALVAHPWPGNFRELDRAMERVLFLHREGDRIGADAVLAALAPPDASISGA